MAGKDSLQEDSRPESEDGFGKRQNVKLVHQQVRQAILAGDNPAGSQISQVRLAAELGVSRIPLREALRLLEREGLVESETNHRVRVAALSVSDLEQLYAIRMQLEALGVRLTVPRFGKEDLVQLKEILTRMDDCARAQDYEGWEVPHRAFHDALVANAGDRLTGMISQLYDHAKRYRRAFMMETSRSWDKSMKEHRDIFEVCKGGDVAVAAERLTRHYAMTALSLMATMAPEHDPVVVRTALRAASHYETANT